MNKILDVFDKCCNETLEQFQLVNKTIKNICVVGLGYIGLPTASLLANRGYDIHGVDVNQKAIDTINRGEIHIVEPSLDLFVKRAYEQGRLKAYTEAAESDVFMLCVPTPFYPCEVGGIPSPNVEYIIEAVKGIAPYVKSGNIVILESTSPVGTTELVRDTLLAEGVCLSGVNIAYCPERVLPGKIMYELMENDRIVGGIDKESSERVQEFYQTFVVGDVLITDARTAEMSKLVENSSRDVQIAFANELSMICDKLDIDVWEIRELANRHPRVNILMPGCGVGGHCIAVDPWFIVSKTPEEAKIIKEAREINNFKSLWCVEKIKSEAYKFKAENGRSARVVCMGLAFKPDIDDLRESPALKIFNELCHTDINIAAVEPNIREYQDIKLLDVNNVAENADIIVFLVAHKEFKTLNTKDITVLDFCGVRR